MFSILMLGASDLYAQAKKVDGVVVSAADNSPLPGVSVLVKGTTNGAVTNIDGRFSISVAIGQELVFSFIGYEGQIVKYNGQPIKVVLKDNAQAIDEVVVVGYGVQKKKLSTGATVQVKGDQIQKMSTVSPLNALKTQTPGVNIVKNSGEPGAGFKVNIRGIGTIGNSQPLYVVDGVVLGNIDYLDPSSIESIDILKDAASAAIYGSRAANGVVLVTTKQGKSGKVSLSYDGYYGVQNLYKRLPMLDAKQYAMIQNEAAVNSNLKPYDFASMMDAGDWDRIQNGTWSGTNWLKELENKNAPIQSHSVSITGGGDQSVFSSGFTYSSQDGIFGTPVPSHYERYSFRLNSEHTIYKVNGRDVVKVGENLNYSKSENHVIATGNMWYNDINQAIRVNPFLPLYARDANGNDIVGTYHKSIPFTSNQANPIGLMYYGHGLNLSKNYSINSNAYITVQPIKGLTYRGSFSYNQNSNSYRSYVPTYELSPSAQRTSDGTTQNMGMGYNWSMEHTLSYATKINDVHSINAVVGTSAEKSGIGEDLSVSNDNSIFDDYKHAYIDNAKVASTATIGGKPYAPNRIISYFGRANYDYKETYMLSMIVRADASSNFAKGNRWGYFPSASAGWVITNESFMNSLKGTLDFLKLRASWGRNGNANIPAFQYLSLISFNAPSAPSNYYFGDTKSTPSLGAYPGNLATSDLSWETSEQLDLGFDARLLSNRLGISFDLYKKKTIDWLLAAPVLASWGIDENSAPYINGGDIENKGFELSLNWNDRLGDFKYGVSANLSYNKNEVTRIANSQGIIAASNVKLWGNGTYIARAEVGKPVGYFWGYETKGIFQNAQQILDYKNADGKVIQPSAEPGDVIFVDKDGNGVIDDKDKTNLGDGNPDALYAINFNCEYKGFDFSVSANGVAGNQIARQFHSAGSPEDNYTTDVLNRWHGEGTSNRIPRVLSGSSINLMNTSDLDIENGDYLRINNVTFGYNFKNLLKKLPFQQIRLYATVQNLYTFTKYSGMDPEIGTSSDDTAYGWVRGVDIGFYPTPRTFLIGASIKF